MNEPKMSVSLAHPGESSAHHLEKNRYRYVLAFIVFCNFVIGQRKMHCFPIGHFEGTESVLLI